MLYTIFDIETTGFSGSRDDVVQFAYLTVDEKFAPVRSGNHYFYFDGMSWSTEAEAVHGLSREFLATHKEESEESIRRMYATLQQSHLVGHNANGFDIPFVNQYLIRKGLPALQAGNCYDTMLLWKKRFGRKLKLTTLTEELGYAPGYVQALTSGLFRDCCGALRPHDACYDVVATFLCFRKAVQEKLCTAGVEVTPKNAHLSM